MEIKTELDLLKAETRNSSHKKSGNSLFSEVKYGKAYPGWLGKNFFAKKSCKNTNTNFCNSWGF